MNKLKQLSVGKQVSFMFGTLGAVLVLIGALLFFSLRSIEHSSRKQLTYVVDESELVAAAAQNAGLMQAVIFRHILASEPAEIQLHDQTVHEIDKANGEKVAAYQKFVDTEEEGRLYAQVLQARKEYMELTEQLLALSRLNLDAQAGEFAASKQIPAYETYQKTIKGMTSYVENEVRDIAAAMNHRIVQIRTIAGVFVIIAILIAIGTGFAVTGVARRFKEDNRFLQIEVSERKQAENALRESEARTRLLVKSSGIGLWEWDLVSNEVFFSVEWKSQLGYVDAELPSRFEEWESRLHPEDREATLAAVKDCREGRRADYQVEFRLRHKDGSWRWILARANLSREATSPPVRMMGCHIDITERKQAEHALRESDEKFHQLADNITDAFWIRSPDMREVHFISRAFERIWGRSVESLYANPQEWTDFIMPEDRERVLAAFVTLTTNAPSLDIEYRILRADGEIRWVRVRGFQVRDAADKLIRITGIVTDITEWQRAAEELLASERRFSDMLRNLDLVSMMLDRDARITYCNDHLLRLTGWKREEVMGGDWFELFLPPELYKELRRVQSALLDDQPAAWHYENEIVTRSGERRLIRWNNSVLRSTAGHVIGTASIGEDITERKQVESALETSEARTKAIVQSSLDCIITMDHEGKILEFNPAAEKVFGHARAGVLGRDLAEVIIPPSLREQHREGMLHYLATGESKVLGRRIEMTAIRSDGSEFPVELAITRMGREKPPIFTGFIRDISERKQAEETLERLREQHALILNSVDEGVHGLGLDGKIIFENPVAAAMLGHEITDLIGRSAHATMHHTRPDGTPYPRSECPIHATLADGLVRHVKDEVFWRKDGTSFPVEYTSTPLREKGGGIIGATVVFSDSTERKRLEAQLLQSQKMETVGKLAGGVAHEFNSIMTAIIGQSELLLNDLSPGNPLCKNATEIRKAADRAATLTRQLLAYGGKQMLRPEILDLNSVLSGMESTLRHLLGRDSDVCIALAGGLKAVKADAGQLEQVIMNIVMNAADAMPNGGKLTLETANVTLDQEYVGHFPELKAGEYVMLAISDSGTGMSEEVKARVFEPFFTTKGVGQGTGLGLSTCYGIVKQSGGHITIYSEPGRGATFKIYLPQVQAQTKVPIQPLDAPGLPRGTETILLVEDDPALRDMAATLLRRLGYKVLAAANGIEALSLQQQPELGQIDLLFTDVVMPNMSGKELSERVQALYPHIRILFTSAYTANAIVHQGVLNKGMALLQKPFTPSALASKLREVLDQPSPPEGEIAAKTLGLTEAGDAETAAKNQL